MLADCKAPPPPPRDLPAPPEAAPKARVMPEAGDMGAKADSAIKRAATGPNKPSNKPSSVFDKLMDAGKQMRQRIDEERQQHHDSITGAGVMMIHSVRAR